MKVAGGRALRRPPEFRSCQHPAPRRGATEVATKCFNCLLRLSVQNETGRQLRRSGMRWPVVELLRGHRIVDLAEQLRPRCSINFAC